MHVTDTPQRAVWAHSVVMLLQGFDQDLYLFERVEYLPVK